MNADPKGPGSASLLLTITFTMVLPRYLTNLGPVTLEKHKFHSFIWSTELSPAQEYGFNSFDPSGCWASF